MKWNRWVMCGLVGMGLSGPASAVVEATEGIGLMAAGGVTADVQEELKAHMEQYLPCPVTVLPAAAPAGTDTIEAEAEALAQFAPGHRGVIGLVSAREDITAYGVYLPDRRVAVINVTALSKEDGKTLNRLKKESMRCAGLLLGLKPCPDPRCSMHHYLDLQGLDAKGGNFCPPCVMTLQEIFPEWQPYGPQPEEASAPAEAAAEPVATEPVATEPAMAEPAAPEPAAPEPAVVEPVVVEPVAPMPAMAEPAAVEPAAAEPAVAEPTPVH